MHRYRFVLSSWQKPTKISSPVLRCRHWTAWAQGFLFLEGVPSFGTSTVFKTVIGTGLDPRSGSIPTPSAMGPPGSDAGSYKPSYRVQLPAGPVLYRRTISAPSPLQIMSILSLTTARPLSIMKQTKKTPMRPGKATSGRNNPAVRQTAQVK